MTQAYPLQWPPGWPRTLRPDNSRFDTGFADARDSLLRELRLMGAQHVVLSSNLPLRRDGLPYAKPVRIDDCGVAVYFMLKGNQQCIPCDRWNSAADNVQAIRKTVEALRGLERWGAKSMVDAAFRGFEALPPPKVEKPWWEIMGVDRNAGRAAVERAYRDLARRRHPDAGGSDAMMAELNVAKRQALGQSENAG